MGISAESGSWVGSLPTAAVTNEVRGGFPPSHTIGIVPLAVWFPVAFATDRLMVGGLSSVILIIVAVWQSLHAPDRPEPAAGH